MAKDKTELTLIQKNRGWLTSEKLKKQIAENLPRHCTPDRFMRIVLAATQKAPLLVEATQSSLFQAMMDLSARGLEPDGYHAHLIPFKNNRTRTVECQLIVDYKGLIAQMRRSGEISDINAEIVRENDDFQITLGTERKITHLPALRDRGDVELVYSVVKMKDGTVSFDWMSIDDIEKVRKSSRASNNGPWVDWWEEMAKKTVIKRHAKLLPLSDESRDIINLDNAQDQTPLSSAERFKNAKPAETLDPAMFDSKEETSIEKLESPAAVDEVSKEAEEVINPEPVEVVKPVVTHVAPPPAEKPVVKEATQTSTAVAEPVVVEAANAVEQLQALAIQDKIKLTDLTKYATDRKLDISSETDAKRLVNAWKTVSRMINPNF